MIKKLNEIKPKMRKDTKRMCDKIDALKIKYQDHFLGVDKAVHIRTNASSS